MHLVPLLFAAGFDWLEALAGSAVVILWILSQVINLFRAAANRTATPAPPAPPAPDRRPPAGAGRPQRPRRGTDAQADVERQIEDFLRGRREGGRVDRPAGPPARPRTSGTPAAPEVSGSAVSRHVADAFAHNLDHLSSGLEARVAIPDRQPAPPTVANELATALRSPTTLRQLILLREVLDRPTERW